MNPLIVELNKLKKLGFPAERIDEFIVEVIQWMEQRIEQIDRNILESQKLAELRHEF